MVSLFLVKVLFSKSLSTLMNAAVVLFTLEGCGPCSHLLQSENGGFLQKIAAECRANAFAFSHYSRTRARQFKPRDPPAGVKQSDSFPELCFVTYSDGGQVQQVQSFAGANDIQNFSCWLRNRSKTDKWVEGWLCPE
jgi:hypothetical protein